MISACHQHSIRPNLRSVFSSAFCACQNALVVLNAWEPESQEPECTRALQDLHSVLVPLTEELRDTKALSSTDMKVLDEQMGSLDWALSALGAGELQNIAGVVKTVGGLFRSLTRVKKVMTRDESVEPPECSVIRRRAFFLQLDEQLQRVECPDQITQSALTKLFARVFSQHLPANARFAVKNPSANRFYPLANMNDISDGAIVRLQNTSDDICHDIDQSIPSESCKIKRGQPSEAIPSACFIDIKRKAAELSELRGDLAILKQEHRKWQHDISSTIRELTARIAASNIKESEGERARRALLSSKEKMLCKSESITARITRLRQVIDALRVDVTRRIRPRETHMRAACAEVTSLQEDITDFQQFINDKRPSWKKTWEDELQEVVREQSLLKQQEGKGMEMEDSIADIAEVFKAVEHFSQILGQPTGNTGSNVSLNVLSAEEAEDMRLASVLREMQLVTDGIDSKKRLEALERSEQVRRWERDVDGVNDSAFIKELHEAARNADFSDGIAKVERMRAMRDRENIMAMFRG